MDKNLYIGTRLKTRHFKIQPEKWGFFYQLYRFSAPIKIPSVYVKINSYNYNSLFRRVTQ